MAAKRGKKRPPKKAPKKSTPKRAPEPIMPKTKKPQEALEAPVPAPSLKAVVAAPKVEAPKPRDPELPPLSPPTPDPPTNPAILPFAWKKKRPESRPCHGCYAETKLTTNVADVGQHYSPQDGEGMFHEMFENLIVNVICAACWRRGWGHDW